MKEDQKTEEKLWEGGRAQKTKDLQYKLDLEFYESLPEHEKKNYYWHNGKNKYQQEKKAIINQMGLSPKWERCSTRYIKTHVLPDSWITGIAAVLFIYFILACVLG